MKTGQELYEEHLGRLKTAIALEKPDRVPVILLADAFVAAAAGIKLSEFVNHPLETNLRVNALYSELGDIDAIEMPGFYPPALGNSWLSKMKLPGRELRDDEYWQIDEVALMTEDDYDFIIDKGWDAFFADYCTNRLDNALRHFAVAAEIAPPAILDLISKGIVPFAPVSCMPPIEAFCGGRGIARFSRDMYRIPDKVEAAMDVTARDMIATVKSMVEASHPVGVFIGGARGASTFMNPKLWERFVFKYVRQMVDTVIEAGAIPYLHFDGDWIRDLPRFLELPKGKCLFSLDGLMDIFEAKKILGDHMCLMGDVPPAMLTLGTPDEVYKYSERLIKEIGPSGFILAMGCTVPPNAKMENVKAMISAATGK